MVDAVKAAAVAFKKKLFDQLKSQRAINNRGHRTSWFVPDSDDSRGRCGGGKNDWDAVYQEIIGDTETAASAYEDFDAHRPKKEQPPPQSSSTPQAARGDCGGGDCGGGDGGDATLDSLVALYAYAAQEDGHLSFARGERLDVFVDERQAWWLASNSRGQVGLVPSNYLSATCEPEAPQTPSIDAAQAPKCQPKPLPQPRPRPAPRDASRRRSSAPTESQSPGGPMQVPSQQPVAPASRRPASEETVAKVDAADGECTYVTLDSGELSYFYGGIGRDQCENFLVRNGDFLLRDSRDGQLTLSVKGKDRIHHFLVATLADGSVAIGHLTFPLFSKLVDYYREHAIYKSDSQRLLLEQPVIREQRP